MHRALAASLTTLILGLYGIAATAADTAERCADGVTLIVANFREAWQYCLHSSEPAPRFVIHTRKSSVERWPRPLIAVTDQLEITTESRRAAAQAQTTLGAKWADYSPNCQLVVAGSDNPVAGPIYTFKLFGVGSAAPIVTLSQSGSRYFKEFGWTPDSRYLYVVETFEQHAKSPLAFLSALAGGQPVPLHSLSLIIVDTTSGQSHRIPLLNDVSYATVAFLSEPKSCGAKAQK